MSDRTLAQPVELRPFKPFFFSRVTATIYEREGSDAGMVCTPITRDQAWVKMMRVCLNHADAERAGDVQLQDQFKQTLKSLFYAIQDEADWRKCTVPIAAANDRQKECAW